MDNLISDPVLVRMCSSFVAVILIISAWQKLRDISVFEAAVSLYQILPERLEKPFAWLLPITEILAGLALLFDSSRATGVVLGLLAIGIATGGIIINLLRGNTAITCGCGGADDHTPLSWALVIRNLTLITLLLTGSQTGSTRSLVWIDYLSVGAGTFTLMLLYAATNQLLTNHPRLAQLRSRS